jgi:STIP1 family protein 1
LQHYGSQAVISIQICLLPAMAHIAEQLKQKGNDHFRKGEYESAVALYSQAIQKDSRNPLLFTNRANARLKLGLWHDVIDDCLRSIDILRENMKGYYFLGKFIP